MALARIVQLAYVTFVCLTHAGDNTGTKGSLLWHNQEDMLLLEEKEEATFHAVNTLGWTVTQTVGMLVQLPPGEHIGAYGLFEDGSAELLRAQAEQRNVRS
jgi:hypothetical protein